MEQEKTIRNILSQREDFVVVGLTGRMGSGCSKVAEVLATPYDEMKFPHPIPQKGQESLSENGRTLRILADYAESHWVKFDVIRVGAVIASFILNNDSVFLFDLSRGGKPEEQQRCQKEFRLAVLKDCYIHTVEMGIKYNLLDGPVDPHDKGKQQYLLEGVAGTVSDSFIQICPGCFFRKLEIDSYKSKLKL